MFGRHQEQQQQSLAAAAAAAAAAQLRRIGFTQAALEARYGFHDSVGSQVDPALSQHPPDALDTAFRLLVWRQPVASAEIEQRFGAAFIGALEAVGLASIGADGEVRANATVLPAGDFILCSDGLITAESRTDHVLEPWDASSLAYSRLAPASGERSMSVAGAAATR